MSDTYSYEVLEPGGHARLVGNVLDRISRASANPSSAVGSAAALLGDPETASWMERTTAADGAALIESVRGNTVVQDGSLLPVRMEGIETVGFNQWDEQWESGYVDGTTGANVANAGRIRSKNHIPVLPSTAYCNSSSYTLCVIAFDADKGCLGEIGNINGGATFTTPAGCRFIRFWRTATTYNHDICINISDPSRNGTYEPHWSSQRAIPAATYFPQGMRSAGSVRDELRADAAVTRVGVVDLGTLTWSWQSTWESWYTDYIPTIAAPSGQSVLPNLTHESYDPLTYNEVAVASTTKTGVGLVWSSGTSGCRIVVKNGSTTTQPTGMLHYELATPTVTPIDPPLPLSYRVGAGGTERVMVASGTTSAPPVFATRYPLDPADLAASIAPVDGPTATTNHQVGDLIMLGFTLCKATQVIVTGETIAIGTNVTKTTVAAELAALSE